MNVVGASAPPNGLTKTAPESAWNAGAASFQTIPGDGYVEFSTGEITTAKMAGLSHGDSTTHQDDIDFAVRLKRNGTAAVYEAGILRGDNLTTYVAGDVFRVESLNGVVTYSKNGIVFYTSSVAPNPPLLVDTSLNSPGATIEDVALVSTDITWQNAVGVNVSGSSLAKTGTKTAWNAGASSAETITGEGFMEFTTAENTTAKMAGLSVDDANRGSADIDFAIRLKRNGLVAVYEAGTLRGDNLTTYVAGDRFRVNVYGGAVQYEKNGETLYTSTVTPSFSLRVDTSLYSPGATINRVIISDMAAGALRTCLWDVPIVLDSGDGNVSQPQIAVDSSGNAIAVWTQVTSGQFRIWHSEYRLGIGWTTAQELDPGAIGNAGSPQVGMDDSGNALVVWFRSGSGNWWSRYVPGTGWSVPAALNTNGSTGVAIAVNRAGDAMAIWGQYAGDVFSLWSRRFTPASEWDPPEKIDDVAPGGGSSGVGLDDNGNAIFAWAEERPNGAGTHQIVSRRHVPGEGWGPRQTVSSGTLDFVAPSLAVNASGSAVVVWQLSPYGDGIYANTFDPLTGWGIAQPIDGGLAGTGPKVAIDGAGNAIAYWFYGHARLLAGVGWEAATPPLGWTGVALAPSGDGVGIWGNGLGVWTNRYLVDSGWQPDELLSSQGWGSAVAVNETAGVALFVKENAMMTNDLWTSRCQ